MIPVIGSAGWFLMPLRPTQFTPAMIAKVHVVDDKIVSAFVRKNVPDVGPYRRLHWSAGFGSWGEAS